MTYAEPTRARQEGWAATREFESRIFGFPGLQRPCHHVVPLVSLRWEPVVTEVLSPTAG